MKGSVCGRRSTLRHASTGRDERRAAFGVLVAQHTASGDGGTARSCWGSPFPHSFIRKEAPLISVFVVPHVAATSSTAVHSIPQSLVRITSSRALSESSTVSLSCTSNKPAPLPEHAAALTSRPLSPQPQTSSVNLEIHCMWIAKETHIGWLPEVRSRIPCRHSGKRAAAFGISE